MDLTKTRQLFLVALSSSAPGESFNALQAIKTILSKTGKDIHWLASSLGSSTSQHQAGLEAVQLNSLRTELMIISRQRDAAIADNNRLRQEIMLLRVQNQSPYQAQPLGANSASAAQQEWLKGWGQTPQKMAESLLLKVHRLTHKEADFLETVAQWRGTPTAKQLAWLEALWEKYG